MKPVQKWLRKLLEDFNSEWRYELKAKIILWSKDYAEYESLGNGSGVIRVNSNQKKIDIAEDFYHELGHAILDQYIVPSKYLKTFRNNSPLISREKASKLDLEEFAPPPNGYVSNYSLVNGTEEFCEILSAWACSGYKMKGRIDYGPWSHSIDIERNLKRKILRIHKILTLE